MTTDTAARRIKPVFLLPFVIFFAAVVFFALPLLQGKDPSNLPSAMLDKPAPDFVLPGLSPDIPRLRHDMLKGRVTLVNVFASWCVPCRAEHPNLTAFAANNDIPLYGIAYKDRADAAKKWLARHGNPYDAIAHDEPGLSMIDWGVYGVPETYVIDAEGMIRHRHAGPLGKDDIEQTILPLIAELAAEPVAEPAP